ncbi:MAG: hypothetical protein JWM78_3167 [Verrucomicrobiaceae bacterium]|nr:hypothetical protein [Verrucomicrobiaceae bacterium]
MQIKDILKNVGAACSQRWPNTLIATEKSTHVEQLVEILDTLKPLLKQAKLNKQECARRFGQAKTDGLDIEPIKLEMQRLSAELDRIELRRKEIEEQICNLFVDDTNNAALTPQQFGAYQRDLSSQQEIAGPISVREIVDGDQGVWDAYVDSHPHAALYHRYHWRNVIADSFDHSSIYLLASTAHGATCGILPLVRLRSRLFGDFAVSMPFFNYGGPLTNNNAATVALLNKAQECAQVLGISHLEIRATRVLNEWPRRTDKVSMIKILPDNTNALDDEIGAKIRAQIKRAQREDPQIAIGHLDLLDDFYRVFSINMRDLGTPVYGKEFFRNILTAMPNQSHLVIVRLNNKPVAAAFLLGHRDMMEIPWASTLRTVNTLNMNMLLYHAVLGFCIERKYRFFDFGRSTQDSGTFNFKRQWGAQPVQHYWHYWLSNGGELPALKPDSPKFRLLIACWQKLPVVLANVLGPRIVKNLP